MRSAALLVCVGVLTVAGCGGGGAAATCGNGLPCNGDGGLDATGDLSPAGDGKQ